MLRGMLLVLIRSGAQLPQAHCNGARSGCIIEYTRYYNGTMDTFFLTRLKAEFTQCAKDGGVPRCQTK